MTQSRITKLSPLSLMIAGHEIEMEFTSRYRLTQALIATLKVAKSGKRLIAAGELVLWDMSRGIKMSDKTAQTINGFFEDFWTRIVEALKIMIRANDLRPLPAPFDSNEFWKTEVTTSEIGLIITAFIFLTDKSPELPKDWNPLIRRNDRADIS